MISDEWSSRGFVPDVRLPSIGECATIVAAVQLRTLVVKAHANVGQTTR